MAYNRFCNNCGGQLMFYDPTAVLNSLERSGWVLTAIAKERLRGYIEIAYYPSKKDDDESKGRCRFTIYDSSGRKWDKLIGKASTKSQVLYEGLVSFIDSVKRSTQIDLFTSERSVVNQINRKAGLPGDKMQTRLCEALRHFLPKYKGISLNYLSDSELKTTIRQLKPKAVKRPFSLMGEEVDNAVDDEENDNPPHGCKYCFHCGKKLPKYGLRLKAEAKTIPSGFIEVLFEEGSRKKYSAEAPNSLGRFRVFVDGDLNWMYPITGAVSPSHVLYLGLANFINEAVDEGAAIHLYTNDIDAVNALLEKKGEPLHPDEQSACRYVKSLLKSRPLITFKYLESRLFNEKMSFIKARYIKGQKGMKLPVLDEKS